MSGGDPGGTGQAEALGWNNLVLPLLHPHFKRALNMDGYPEKTIQDISIFTPRGPSAL